MTDRLLGAVLAGGRSRRFGRDKTREEVGGRRMLERSVVALEPVASRVVVVSSRPDTPGGGWSVIPDLRPAGGPLAGIEAALAEARSSGYDAVFVLASDLPLVDSDLVARILRGLDGAPAAAAARQGEPDHEPLCAVYRSACLVEASRLLDEGRRAARALFEAVQGVRVPVDPRRLLNVNRIEDLHRAEARLARPGEAREP